MRTSVFNTYLAELKSRRPQKVHIGQATLLESSSEPRPRQGEESEEEVLDANATAK